MPNTPSNVVPMKARENSSKVKIESNEGKVPEAIAGMNFTTEQLPTLSDDEGYVPSAEEVKGEGKSTLPADKKEEIEAKLEEKAAEKAEKEEKPEGELTEEKEEKSEVKEEEGIERFLKPPKGSQAEKDAKAKKGSKDTFDYSTYSEEEVSILKNMPAGNREKVGKLFKNEKDSAKNQQNQFYQSPEGYLLHPGYREEVSNIQLAEREAQIWSKMLKDAKNGIAIKPLEGWNKQTGEPVFGAEVKATDEVEEQLRNNFNQCLAVASQKREAVNNFVKNFPKLAGQDMQAIRAERAKRFAWIAKPALLDHSIETTDGDKTIRQVRSDIASLFPGYMRNNEAVEACGDLMVALMIAKAELAESKKGQRVSSIKKEEESSFEPRGDIKPKKAASAGFKGGPSTFTTEGASIEI